MSQPISAVSNVEVVVLEFNDNAVMEEKLAEYLLKGFTIEAVTPSIWKTSEKPAAFSYWETEARAFTVILAKRDFTVNLEPGKTSKPLRK